MSLQIKVYCKQLSDGLIPKIVERLNDYEMSVEIYPGISFENAAGFVPFKFTLTSPHLTQLKDKALKSGFELFSRDFDLKTEMEELSPKPGFFDRLLGKKISNTPLASPDIQNQLMHCKKVVSFVWSTGDSFELRFAFLTSSILTELTGGVCYYPADNLWYPNENIVDNAYEEIRAYELTLKELDLRIHEFEGW